jgi:nucleotide-binding universal stress UspA family protein
MFRHVLIPTDGTELSQKAVIRGIALAKSIEARLTILMASPPFHVISTTPRMLTNTKEQYMDEAASSARKHLKLAENRARFAGLRCDTTHVFHDYPYQAIIEVAQARDCDLIVMATRGHRGIAAMLLGGETQELLTHCEIPVLVWR